MSEAQTSRNEPKKERQTKQKFRAMFLDLSESKFCAENLDLSCAVWMRKSTSAPVTSMDGHTNTV